MVNFKMVYPTLFLSTKDKNGYICKTFFFIQMIAILVFLFINIPFIGIYF